MAFKIEVMWHNIGNVISFDIDFHLIYFFTFLSKALLHHIDNATGLCGQMLYII